MIQGHLFEIYTIVAALHESIDVVIGMKNMVELEGILNTRTSLFDFLSRSIPIYPLNGLKSQTRGQSIHKDCSAIPEANKYKGNSKVLCM